MNSIFEPLIDVIGRPARIHEFVFVPILGYYSFGDPTCFIDEYENAGTLPAVEEEYDISDANCWWARARVLSIFGIDHPVGRNLSKILDFMFAAVWQPLDSSFMNFVPIALTDTKRQEYGPTTSALRFPEGVSASASQRLAFAFWELLLQDKKSLGVFLDYFAVGWHVCDGLDKSSEGALYAVSCDGSKFDVNFRGHLNPDETPLELESFDRSEFWDPNRPFVLPKKRRNKAMNLSRRARLTY